MKSIKDKIANFLNSIYFIVFINIIGVMLWYFEQPLISYIIYILSFALILITNAKRIVVLTLILNGLIGFRVVSTPEYGDLYKNNLLVFLPIVVFTLGLAIYDFVYKRKEKIQFKNDILYGLMAIVIANVLSLINADKQTIWLICLGIGQTLSFVIIYIYIYNVKDEGSTLYLSKSALVMGLAITAQIIIYLITRVDDYDSFYFPLGWGNRNTISIMYMAIIPLTFYIYFKDQTKKYALYLVGIYIVMILIMISRGAYLTMLLLAIPFFIITYPRMDDKRIFLKDLSIAGILLVVVCVIFIFGFGIGDIFYEHIISKILIIFDLTGREEIYPIGYNLFLKYPFFGAGSYTGAYFLRTINAMSIGSYHNYVIHIIATTGIVGILSFVYYIRNVLKTTLIDEKFNLCVLFIILNFLVHGLFDNTFFNPLFMIFLSLVLPLLNTEGKLIFELWDNPKEKFFI